MTIQGLYPGWIQQRLITPLLMPCGLLVAIQLLIALRFVRLQHKSGEKE
jgi:hypothetical protein